MNLPELATRRRVTIGMLTLTMVLFGLIGLVGLKVNLLPDLSYPTLTVRTEYEGAAPLEIENLISQPVEEAVGVVKNVRKVHSVSRTGQSDVVLEFAWGTDMDMASLEVRDKLDTLQLPLEAKKPLLLRFNPSTDPIIRLGLTVQGEATEAQLKQLRRFADDDLKKRIEPVVGVAAVKVGGGLEDEIDVSIDQQKLARLGIDINDVITRLKNENVNASGGRIEEASQRFLVRTINQFKTLDEMRELLIKIDGNVPIRLKDIAEVRQGYKEREGIVRIDGREAIELAIYKEGDANTVSVATAVKAQLAKLQDTLPSGTTLTTIEDQSIFIEHALSEVKFDALLGGVLAILIIFFFLGDSWSTFIISLSLPVSLIATFFFMGQLHLSLNVMSLGGLALATGMVVDDSIVVLENIARLREKGVPILEAAVRGTAEVGMAVTASTLTTVAVFFPLVFVQGIAGQLFRDQALTITFAMLVSLLVSMTLIPMLASLKGRSPLAYREEPTKAPRPLPDNRVLRALALGARALGEFFGHTVPRLFALLIAIVARFCGLVFGRVLRFIGRFVIWPYDRAAAFYHRSLPKALEHPWRVLGLSAAALAATLTLVPTLGLDLIPQLAQGRFDMTVTLPPGTPLAETDKLVAQISERHAKDPGVASIYGVAGAGTRLDANPTESGENIARLSIALKDGGSKAIEAAEIERLRAGMTRADASMKFARPQLFSFSAPLEIEIRGYDLDALAKGGQRLAELMKASPRFTDVKSTVEGGYPEIQVRFDQDRAAALGLTTRDIADRLVRKVKGEVATRYEFRDRKIDVLVRARASDRGSVDDIRNLVIGYVPAAGAASNGSSGTASSASSSSSTAASGSSAKASENAQSNNDTPIRLSAVADVIASEGPSEIHRVSQERVAIVSSNLRYGDLSSAVAEVQQIVATHPLAAGVKTRIGGQSEELDSSVQSLVFALGLAIFLVYLVMASQFESLLHPFVIMFSIPLAAVGAILALKLSGSAISVVVFIGLIMLVGIVVKNAIVLIDRVNQLREAGVPKREALAQGAESRLRPIVMTTLCTLIGFMPLAIGVGEGAEVRAPMALTVIGGLAVSTLLTLVVIPVVYDLLDRRGDQWYVARGERHRAKIAEAAEPDAAGEPA
ncbi:efflux RND transporter permease subunit [Dokdonella sp.]|uniref:efflux RND transporter permease subunit n=1 Tax=Dokdonella sp. TaxID=2291710 RepID=UPI001B1219C6|nr:efflux RND transporter permease subunit [Dokdonella sp.]MBO9663379.1 efflux RND transporter permease subunit [Dokdonella sp.]